MPLQAALAVYGKPRLTCRFVGRQGLRGARWTRVHLAPSRILRLFHPYRALILWFQSAFDDTVLVAAGPQRRGPLCEGVSEICSFPVC